MVVDPITGLMSWVPSVNSPAQVPVALQVYDSSGALATQSYTLTVGGVNQPPAFAGLPSQFTGKEGALLSIPVNAIDPENQPLTFWADNLPPGAVFDAAGGTLLWTPAYGAAGTYPNVTFTVSDGIRQVTQSVSIVIAPNPQPPTLLQPADLIGQEGSPIQFTLQASDTSGAPLSYSSTELPGGATLDPATGLFHWTPGYTQEGIFKFPVTVSDGLSSTTQTANIVVLHADAAPAFQNLTPFQVLENQPFQLQPVAFDANNPGFVPPVRNADGSLVSSGGSSASVIETVSGMPAGATFDPITMLFSWTPTFEQSGPFPVTFTATKTGSAGPLVATETVTINVLPVDRPPQLTEIVDQIVNGGNALDVPVHVVDPDGDPVTLAVAGLPAFATFIDHGDGTGNFHFAPGLPDLGNYTITLQATDDGRGGQTPVLSAIESFVLAVHVASEPPHLDYIGDKVAKIGSPFQLTVHATELDQQPLTFSADGLPAGATITPSAIYGQATVSWVPTADDAGVYGVTFHVTNTGNGDPALVASDQQTMTLTVRATDGAPVLPGPGDQSVAEGHTLTVALSGTDPDGDNLTYSVANAPPGATFDPALGILTWVPNLFQAGDYHNIVFGASDGFLTSFQSITIHVTQTDQPPKLLPVGNRSGRENAAVQFTLLATDPDGDTTTYASVTPLPTHAQLDAHTGQFTWTPDFAQAGNYTLTFSATDTAGLTDTTVVSVQIANVDRSPAIQVADQSVILGGALQFTLKGTDPDAGDSLTFSATGLPDGATLDANTGVVMWTPAAGQAGDYPVVFSVSDGELSAAHTAVIHALLVAQAPAVTLEITPSFPSVPGEQVVVHASATGLASIATLTLSMNGQPVTLDAQGRYHFTATTPGRVEFRATATDVEGQTGQATGAVRILDPADTTPPTVLLDSTLSGALLTTATPVTATIADSNLDSWTLQIAPLGATAFTTLATGTAPVIHGKLASLDPGVLQNGVYQLQLVATDIGGRMSQTSLTLQVDTATKAGQYLRTETDLTVHLGTAALSLTRIYDSLGRSTSTSLGFGWSLAGQDTALQTSVPPTGQESDGIFNAFVEGTRVYLTLPSGQRVGFTFKPVRHNQSGVTWYTPAYVADTGVTWHLDSVSAVLIRGGNGFYDAQTAIPYNPANNSLGGPGYTLKAPDGTVYHIDAVRGVVDEVLPGGERLYYSGSGISSSSGDAVRFIRDADGRITTIEAPDGTRMVYAYDDQGNLASAHNTVSGQSSRYGYALNDPHLLTLATAPAAGTGAAVTYGTTVHTVPLTADLGGTSQFLASNKTGSLAAGATASFAFLLTAAELASTPSGTVLVGVRADAATGSSLKPAIPSIAGLTPLVGRTSAHSSFALFVVNRAGLELLQVSGANASTSGAFTLQILIAGDANQDGNVDGADGTLVAGLLGTLSGQPSYIAADDGNENGAIDAADVQLIAANYGFHATRPPVVQAATTLTHAGLAAQFDLAPLATDPQGDPVFFRIVGASGGTATLNPDGHTARFVPANGFTGSAELPVRSG